MMQDDFNRIVPIGFERCGIKGLSEGTDNKTWTDFQIGLNEFWAEDKIPSHHSSMPDDSIFSLPIYVDRT
jgi:hypothetical protein